VRTDYPRPAAAVIALAFFSIPGFPQEEAPVLAGEVTGAPEGLIRGFAVELDDMAGQRVAGPADVQPDGAFEFRHVPCGEYIVKLETSFRELVNQDFVNVRATNEPLVIQWPKKAAARPPSGGVAAARLQHPPAKKALQAFLAAQNFSNAGRYEDAARELERAVAISPGYADAHSNLGAQYMRLGRYEEGIAEIGEAMRIGTPSAVDLANLACGQYELHRYDEGLLSARAALLADPTGQSAHFIMGLLLVRDRRTLREAIHHLEMADSIGSARAVLEQARAALAAMPEPAGPD